MRKLPSIDALYTHERSSLTVVMALGQTLLQPKPNAELDEETQQAFKKWVEERLADITTGIKNCLDGVIASGKSFCEQSLAKAAKAMSQWAGGLDGKLWKEGLADDATLQQLLSKSDVFLQEQTASTVTTHFQKLQKERRLCDE